MYFLIKFAITIAIVTWLATYGANTDNQVHQAVLLVIIFLMGRGLPDVTKQTNDSWKGFWGIFTSPFVAAALIFAGLVDGPDPTFYYVAAICHLVGMILIRFLWWLLIRRSGK